MSDEDARRAVDRVARDAYGRLVAMLAARTGDIAMAEDALGDAFVSALRSWPVTGIPAEPTAWLLTAARRTASNVWRHARVQALGVPELSRRQEVEAPGTPAFPDERLTLLFVCAHPAIDPAARTPLMLQTVLGLDAARIARAFLVPPATMSQRLVRAKARIRDAGIRFEVPDPAEWPERALDVHHAIYAAFGAGWDIVGGADDGRLDLVAEALYLGRLLVSLRPDDAEAQGLLALMLYCDARRDARLDASGAYVPLRQQDSRRWSRSRIIEAEGLLTSASRQRTFGRFQCEAAIQSVHVHGAATGRLNHAALDALYRMLVAHTAAVGASVAHAAARLDAGEAGEALAILDRLPPKPVADYQPYWVTRAHVLAALGRRHDACEAVTRGLAQTPHAGAAAYLREVRRRWCGDEAG
jgi:RNA polymerase sigma-70 factor (ECF subfamily)